MGMTKHAALNLSVILIIAYWLYQLLSISSRVELPTEFTDFALHVGITKLAHITIISLLVWLSNETWSQLGFTTINLTKQIAYGLIMGLVLMLLFNVGLNSVLGSIFPKPADSAGVMNYFTNTDNLFFWLLLGIVGGGFTEELMRIFVLTRFENKFGLVGLYTALIVSSLLFGMGHLYQGIGTAISTGISGFVMGMIYVKRRKAWEIITIHAFSDVLSILAAFYLNSR
jgi:membrane protease YdiL (CAAX protease family)